MTSGAAPPEPEEAGAAEAAAARSRGSSFYAGMRILPRAQREAMFEIYSFCRAVDDIADDGGPRAAAQGRARAVAARYRRALRGRAAASLPPASSTAARAFDLQRDDFHAVIDGMEMDVDRRHPGARSRDARSLLRPRRQRRRAPLACGCSAWPRMQGVALAHHLGRALQLTNILRDLDEDAAIGRLYLPREASARRRHRGRASRRPCSRNPALGAACAPVIAMADGHFREARKIMARCPRKSVRAPMIMAEAYQPILAQVDGARLRAAAHAHPRLEMAHPARRAASRSRSVSRRDAKADRPYHRRRPRRPRRRGAARRRREGRHRL